ncbi:MAG TPA: FMN-binding negative transcriptional regulator [Phnomibacter sp.]|nr:FMN-binding negative transcriptional regulator [Phnomibacter sp.]
MYSGKYFKAKENADVLAFMQAHPFITLCGVNAVGEPIATHIPVLIEMRNGICFLSGHVQRKTDHHAAMKHSDKVLGIFTGSHAYISAQWYTPQNTVSTWNYTAVHAHGILHWKDENWMRCFLDRLTTHFENDAQSPAHMKHMSEDYLQQLLPAIEAFEIEVTKLEHVFKLSQNKTVETQQNIVHQLQQQPAADSQATAAIMKRELGL